MKTVLKELCDTGEDPQGQKTQHRDAEILLSLPGIGTKVAATMLAEAHEALEQRDYSRLRCLSGAAPVTRASGKMHHVKMRYAFSERLRFAIYHWANGAVKLDPNSRARYDAMRARGLKHPRALRGVADRLLNLLMAMLRERTIYDPLRRQPVERSKKAA